MVQPGYRKRTIFLLVALLLIRFWFGQTFELSGQEAYLWWEGHWRLSLSYWERGPLVPFLIRVGTLFFGDTEMGVRWLAAVICSSTGFILFYLARHWFNARVAFWTVVLFVVVPMYAWKLSFMTEATASTGLMALAMLAFCLALEPGGTRWWWLLGGTACGLALLVAMPNAWWIAGLALYLAVSPARRGKLLEPHVWGTIIFSALFLIPIIWWWMGAQVSDEAHARLLNAWPFSHEFSLNQGFHFIGLEFFYLSPVFVILLGAVFWRLGRKLWDDPHYGLLLFLAVPGLIWQNLLAFFHEGQFELVPALFLPLVLAAGCFLAQMSKTDPKYLRICGVVLALAALQSLAGLNPFYLVEKSDGRGYRIARTASGENVTGFYASKRQISWRNLASEVRTLQSERGATLVIADAPETASALSFYLPHNQFVYVESKAGVITQFDFWPNYDDSATPNDSAIFVSHSSTPDISADKPSQDTIDDFASVSRIDETDLPLPDIDKSWDFWFCENYVGSGQKVSSVQTRPMPEHESLPK